MLFVFLPLYSKWRAGSYLDRRMFIPYDDSRSLYRQQAAYRYHIWYQSSMETLCAAYVRYYLGTVLALTSMNLHIRELFWARIGRREWGKHPSQSRQFHFNEQPVISMYRMLFLHSFRSIHLQLQRTTTIAKYCYYHLLAFCLKCFLIIVVS